MVDFEKLGVFYLGREYDFEAGSGSEVPLLYDSKDLVTHAVCVGMTGSGKTGLCVGIIEEAAIDGIPSVVIDMKGDLTNLLLAFPSLKASDFRPWVNEGDAQKKGMDAEEFARAQAALWEGGLKKWGQDGERIQKMLDTAEFEIYTPGAGHGVQLSVLQSFDAPPPEILSETDLLLERVSSTVSGLLGLLGLKADPVKSREHILLSNILERVWSAGESLDMGGLISAIQSPPFDRVGFFDIESFYPEKDRFDFAMSLNNLLASPKFGPWMEGLPLELESILHTKEGRPRVAIFSIAHLSDNERMFFLTLLLNNLTGWMRTRPGTTSLRALLYIDEIAGYLPPVGSPSTKTPLLTLLKQARAFGLGLLLATQNPVDLDYKALSNAGTWFIGRLQTEQDKERMLDGLEGAAASASGRFDRHRLSTMISGLGKRVFLMNNVHDEAPMLFETRWVMSYLAGPLTREQIKGLTEKSRVRALKQTKSTQKGLKRKPAGRTGTEKPPVPPGVPECYLPLSGAQVPEGNIAYEPVLLGLAAVYYADSGSAVACEVEVARIFAASDSPAPVDWENPEEISVDEDELKILGALEGTRYLYPSPALMKEKNYRAWSKEFLGTLYKTHRLELFKSPSTGIVSKPGEDERAFRVRLTEEAHAKRDRTAELIRQKYEPKIEKLQKRLEKAVEKLEKEEREASSRKIEAAISIGTAILSSVFGGGRRRSRRTTGGRAATKASRAFKEHRDAAAAEDRVEDLEEELSELEKELQREIESATTAEALQREKLETVTLSPRKSDIAVKFFGLCWRPTRAK